MAEGSSLSDSEGLEKQLRSLLSRYSGDQLGADSEPFCSDFCELVEEHSSHWQVPLPQLRILDIALCYFSRASTFFTTNCDHVQHTISSLALSIFELLLFFDQKDFRGQPLKEFTATFQECQSVLAKYENVYLLQVDRLVQDGGPWSSPALQAILSESSLPQNEVEGCISSELPEFLELRVRYLLSCGRVGEAMALAKCCAQHPAAGRHLFFLQVYLSRLYKTSQHEHLHREVADINGKDAVHIICSLECEETDDLLLALSTAFLSQQLQRGDMYYLCDLVSVWTNLHGRLKKSKQALLADCRQLMLSATNVKSIFPFIRAILQEVGEDGIQFCVELCANALWCCLPCDVLTKTFIYKTIAGLLPNDLEVCRACALLVFFMERTVESYKMVYLLYMLPDQEYHVDNSPIGNNVRFETLQVLKKDQCFDPEFWNLIALRTNCLKLLSEKVVSAALEEIKEDKWISKYCTKEPALRSRASVCHSGSAAKKRHQEDKDTTSKRLKISTGKTRLHDHSLRRKGNQGSQALKESSTPLRRSFWQLDRIHSSLNLRYEDHKRTTRFSEKTPPKRKIKKPRWLLEDSGALEENVPLKMKKNRLKQKRHLRSCVMKRSQTVQIKNTTKLKPSVKTLLKARENEKNQNGFSEDCVKPAPSPQVILELSLPDNELMESFAEDACNRPRGFPQVLFYKPTVKFPDTSPPAKTVHGKEVILRARDTSMFIQLLHCYARRQKGKGNGASIHGSVSTITRSSVQGSPSKELQGEHCEKLVSELKYGTASQTSQAVQDIESQVSEGVLKDQSTKAGMRKTSSAGELSEKSERTEVEKGTKSPDSNRIPQPQTPEKVLQSNTPENSFAEEEDASSQASAAAEEPRLPEVLQPQTIRTEGEPFEEPAVEMKVTIASKSPVFEKVSKASADVSKAQELQTTMMVESKEATEEIHSVSISPNVSNVNDADPVFLNCRGVLLECGEQEIHSLPSQDEVDKKSTADSISTMDAAQKLLENSTVDVPSNDDKSPVKNIAHPFKPLEAKDVSADGAEVCDTSAPMVKELSPKQLDQDQEVGKRRVSDSSTSKEARGESKLKAGLKNSTSSKFSEGQAVSVVVKQENKEKVKIEDAYSDANTNEEFMEMLPETEESKLDHFCTYCNKDFKGPRVVEHAMFHYRKDECTFCRMIFKDDLLAMMHLSDHIETLKRSKDPPACNTSKKQRVSVTKDTSTPKTKAKTTNTPSGCLREGKVRKSTDCPESISDVNPSESRTLRSNPKQISGTSLLKKQKPSKSAKAADHRLNGHVSKKTAITRLKKDLDQKEGFVHQESSQRKRDKVKNSSLQENQHFKTDSSSAPVQTQKDFDSREDGKKKEPQQNLKPTLKRNVNFEEEMKPQEKLCCPVDGCSWSTDLSKNKVKFLYHTLEKHYGEIKPLELAFRVANSKCSICMRVLFSFEHFQHHVERHRLIPRYPCLHQGCTERFKTGIEMRRHTRKHSPLQAMCCLPGCSKLFICLWALNLHEREHYSSKPIKLKKNAQTADNLCKTPVRKKRQTSEVDTEPTAGDGPESIKSACRLSEQAMDDSLRKNITPCPVSTSTASLKRKVKHENRRTKSNVLKNLSNKNTSVQPTFRNLRLRKAQVANTTLDAREVQKVPSLKHSSKFKYNVKKKHFKVNKKYATRRGRLLRQNKTAINETTAGQKLSSKETMKLVRVSSRLKDENEKNQQAQDEVKTTENTSSSKSTQSKDKQITRPAKKLSSNSSKQSDISELKRLKSNDGKLKKIHKKSRRHAPPDSSKSKKNTNAKVKVIKKAIKLGRKQSVPSASKAPAKSKPAVPRAQIKAPDCSATGELKTEVENTDSTQNSVLAAVLESLDLPLPTEETQKEEKKEESKVLIIKKENRETTLKKTVMATKKKMLKRRLDQKFKERQSRKMKSSISALKKSKSDPKRQDKAKGAAVILQGLQRLIKSTLNEKGKRKEQASHKTPNTSAPPLPAATIDETCLSTVPRENRPKENKKAKFKKSIVTNKPEARKPGRKRKIPCDDAKKTSKKICKDCNLSVTKKSAKHSAKVKGRTPSETSAIDICSCSQSLNKESLRDDAAFTPCKETLEEYGKRPHMRLPPTAYLHEKYTTMPKRRKDMLFHRCRASVSSESIFVKTVQQRQRCANCFTTFSSSEELESHIQLQKCSNLFGFDSDEEGEHVVW